MYGAILGDIIGSPYEFDRGEKTKVFPLFSKESHFTDDTVMTIAVASALLRVPHDYDAIFTVVMDSMQHWGHEYPRAGYGGKFREWLEAEEPKPYGSFGNGSAMRVSAVGWLYDTVELTRYVARLTAEVTHNHPEGIKGAESVASAIFLARTGESKQTIKKYIEDEFGYNLSRTLDEIRPNYHMDVTCQGSVPEAIIAFLESTDFEDALRNAVSIGGDTDTTACIAGSIAEAYYGLTPIQEDECLKRIPNKMKDILRSFDRERGEIIQGEPIIEAALRRYCKDSSPENKAAVLDAIYMRMQEDGYFLLPPSEVQKFDECATKADYDGAINIEAYTSDREFFMGLDEEDENAVHTTEVKIYDLLSLIAKSTDADAGIDINYEKNFWLTRDMAKSILGRETLQNCHIVIDEDALRIMSDYKHDRNGIPADWAYLGNDYERYVLGKPGEHNILILGVNPSTAKPGDDDPTIRNVRRITKDKGYDGWIMMNLHPQRTPYPEKMKENAVWSENNPMVIKAVMRAFRIRSVWCAWGNMIDMPGKRFLYSALANVYDVIGENVKWYSYGNLTKDGNPRHPLYMPLTHEFQEFDVRWYLRRKGM